MKPLQPQQVVSEIVAFGGGMDDTSPPLTIPPGFVREAQNFEQDINGGYRRIVGYEVFDGQDSPSDAAYAVLTVTLSASPALGETVTGGTSAATGVIVANPDGQLIITKATGTFESENISGSTTGALGTCVGPAITDGASTTLLHAQYRNLAADEYRADIAAVPGSGNVLGVWALNDVVYAFRNNAGATAVDLYKSTTSGWTQVALGRELAFTSGGTYEIAEGDVITGATSAATATVTRVVLTSGTFAAGTAAGKLIFASDTGTFQAENLNVGANLNVASIAGDSSAITLATPSGRFEFVNHNFGGSVNTTRMYGCDGKNKAFEFDGTVFVPITTGMTTDTPLHITAHKNHLFLSFGGSVQHSSTGNPYVWSPVTGAAEIAMGDTVTGFVPQPGGSTEGALAIFTRNNISILYGSDSSDWVLNAFDEQAGGYAYTMQRIMGTLMLDDRGLTSLATSQNYGNFASAILSKRIQNYLKTKRLLSTASCIVRDKSQYRLFFSDGTALFVTLDNGQVLGMMPQNLTDPVRCIVSAELADGSEAIYFGSSDGKVYQMERGTSFDGDAIEAYIHLAFNSSKGPRQKKRYRHVAFEVSGDGYAAFEFGYELGYGTTGIDQPADQTVGVSLASSYWDSGITWDAFYFDGATLIPAEADIIGSAENVSLKIRSNSDYYEALRISGAIVSYSHRRLMRNNHA